MRLLKACRAFPLHILTLTLNKHLWKRFQICIICFVPRGDSLYFTLISLHGNLLLLGCRCIHISLLLCIAGRFPWDQYYAACAALRLGLGLVSSVLFVFSNIRDVVVAPVTLFVHPSGFVQSLGFSQFCMGDSESADSSLMCHLGVLLSICSERILGDASNLLYIRWHDSRWFRWLCKSSSEGHSIIGKSKIILHGMHSFLLMAWSSVV